MPNLSEAENITDIFSDFSQNISNNEDYDIVSKETVLLVKSVSYLGVVPFLVLTGLACNTMSLAMFLRLKSRTSTVILLLALTVADILLLLNGAIVALFISSTLHGIPLTANQRNLAIPVFDAYINGLPAYIKNILTLLLSMERLFCVLKPMQIRNLSTKKSATIAAILSYIVTLVFRLPNLFLYKTATIFSNNTGQHKIIVTRTEYGKNEELTNIVYITIEVMFRYVPVLGVTIASTITAIALIITLRRRSALTEDTRSGTNGKEIRITKTMLAVTTTFVLCELPGTILRMIIFIDPDMTPYRYKNNIYELAFPLTYLFVLLKCNMNIIIYYRTSVRYKSEFQSLLCCSEVQKGN